MTRTRDRRGEATRAALIEAAERLFALRSIEDVSLREIGSAIGSENTAVALYYFKSKEGLVDAIYRHRLPVLDERRAQLLRRLDARRLGRNSRALLYAHWLPIYEQKDRSGRHTYAGFVGSMVRSNRILARQSLAARYPASSELMSRLHELASVEDRAVFDHRFMTIANMIIGAIREIDYLAKGKKNADRANQLFSDAIEMAAVALNAPAASVEFMHKMTQADDIAERAL